MPDASRAPHTEPDDARFAELVVRYLSDQLADEEAAELTRLLDADPSRIRLLSEMTLTAESLSRMGESTTSAVTPEPERSVERARTRSRSLTVFPIALAAVIPLSAAAVVIYAFIFAGPSNSPTPDAQRPVATLIEFTGNLATPGGGAYEGGYTAAGEYSLDSGTAEFMLTNAVNVRLRGQTRMVMHNDMHVSLASGSAAFVVPQDARGFTVHLPDKSKITDLGTAFEVKVDDTGDYRVHVTEGEVIWKSDKPETAPVLIAAGESARWIGDRLTQHAVIFAPADIHVAGRTVSDDTIIRSDQLNGHDTLTIEFTVTRAKLVAGDSWLTTTFNTPNDLFAFKESGAWSGFLRTTTGDEDPGQHSAGRAVWEDDDASAVNLDAASPPSHAIRITIDGLSTGGFTGVHNVVWQIDHQADTFVTADRTAVTKMRLGRIDRGLAIDFRAFAASPRFDHIVRDFTITQRLNAPESGGFEPDDITESTDPESETADR